MWSEQWHVCHLCLVVPFFLLTTHLRPRVFFNILWISITSCLIPPHCKTRLRFGASLIILVPVLGCGPFLLNHYVGPNLIWTRICGCTSLTWYWLGVVPVYARCSCGSIIYGFGDHILGCSDGFWGFIDMMLFVMLSDILWSRTTVAVRNNVAVVIWIVQRMFSIQICSLAASLFWCFCTSPFAIDSLLCRTWRGW